MDKPSLQSDHSMKNMSIINSEKKSNNSTNHPIQVFKEARVLSAEEMQMFQNGQVCIWDRQGGSLLGIAVLQVLSTQFGSITRFFFPCSACNPISSLVSLSKYWASSRFTCRSGKPAHHDTHNGYIHCPHSVTYCLTEKYTVIYLSNRISVQILQTSNQSVHGVNIYLNGNRTTLNQSSLRYPRDSKRTIPLFYQCRLYPSLTLDK